MPASPISSASLSLTPAPAGADPEAELLPPAERSSTVSSSGIRRASTDDHETVKRLHATLDSAADTGRELGRACQQLTDPGELRRQRKILEAEAAEDYDDLDLAQTGEHPLPSATLLPA